MDKWRVEYTVNGVRTESIVSATSSIDAKKLIEWQYYGQRVCIFNYSRV